MNAELARFTNTDEGVTAVVVASGNSCGGYAVCVRDDDAEMFIGLSIHGLSLDGAIAKAMHIAGIR